MKESKESTGLKGHYRIEVRRKGVLVQTIELDNTLTELYRQAIISNLKGDSPTSLEMKYFAVGTDGTQSSISDTKLGTEIFRSSPTSQEVQGGTLVTTWVLTNEQANDHLREIGVFIGNADFTPDSGVLMSRVNIDIIKTDAEEVTFIRSDIITI